MIWRIDKPKGSPIVVYRNGNPRPEVLFLATKPYPHYYDDGGEEIPDGMIQKWASLEEKSEKPVPNDLEEAARKYEESVPVDTIIYYCGTDEDVYFSNRIVDAFIAGANWDREQMMKEAVEGKIIFLLNGDVAINVGDTDEYKLGDKVRVIVLPKED